MKKLLLGTAALALLTACAGPPASPEAASATTSSPSSNLQFYGTIDAGVGTGKTWR